MNRRVVVTGMGMVTPLGVGVARSWQALTSGQSGTRAIPEELDGHPTQAWSAVPSKVAALVPNEGAVDRREFAESSEARMMTLAMKFGLVAAEEALLSSGWTPKDEEDSCRAGVAVGMAMVDLDYASKSMELVKSGKANRVSPYFVPKLLPNLSAGHIAMRHGLRGPNHSVSTACATGSHAIGDAYNMIKSGSADLMLAGGTEACVNPLVMAGFCRARALSTKFNSDPQIASRPFDGDRDGFVIGEGAGILVLEELEHARQRGCERILGEVLGYGLSGDAHHLTAGREDGDGALRAMLDALRPVGGRSALADLWCINAHATSTPKGDAAETLAISRLLQDTADSNPFIVSNKGAIGHLLGAAGSVESAFALLSINEEFIPLNLNLDNVGEDIQCASMLCRDNVCDKGKSDTIKSRRLVLKNSFGFGGTNVSLLFSNFMP